MISGAKWGLITTAIIFTAVNALAKPVSDAWQAAMLVCVMLFFCTAIILRGLQELWERKP